MLEVVESDFSKLLAEGNAAEAMAVEEYEKLSQDNAIATTEKETAVKYKVKDSKETEAMLAGLKERIISYQTYTLQTVSGDDVDSTNFSAYFSGGIAQID